jgi:hypothetical protein
MQTVEPGESFSVTFDFARAVDITVDAAVEHARQVRRADGPAVA